MTVSSPKYDIEAIRRINNTVVNQDGTIKSFKEQLLEYEYGYYNATLPFIVSPSSTALLQAGANNYPITMDTGTLNKLMRKHDIYPRDIAELPSLILNSNVLMLDSYTYRNGVLCMYLDERGSNGIPLFAAFHLDKIAAFTSINEFSSIYERANIEHTILETWKQGLHLYPNEKTADWILSVGLQLPGDVSNLLNGKYLSVSSDERISNKNIIADRTVNGEDVRKYSLTSASRESRQAADALISKKKTEAHDMRQNFSIEKEGV